MEIFTLSMTSGPLPFPAKRILEDEEESEIEIARDIRNVVYKIFAFICLSIVFDVLHVYAASYLLVGFKL